MATSTTSTTPAATTPVAHPARRSGPARFARGFAWGLHGLMAKEFRSRSRGVRPVLLLTGYLLALAGGVAAFLALASMSGLASSPFLGLQLFSALALGAVLLVAFITPSLTAGAISGERERRTLDLMLVTGASTLGLAAGKLVGSLAYVLFLLTASLPAFAVVFLFGGVPLEYLALAYAIAGATAIAHASLGLLLSALLRRTIVASVVGYLVVVGLVFGLPFVAAASQVVNGGEFASGVGFAYAGGYSVAYEGRGGTGGPPATYTYGSPLVALSSALPTGTPGQDLPMIGDILRLVVGGSAPVSQPGTNLVRPAYLTSVDPSTGEWETRSMWAPWLYYVGGSLAIAPFSIALAALVLSPRKPWRAHPWGGRGGGGPAAAGDVSPAEDTAEDATESAADGVAGSGDERATREDSRA